MGFSKESCRPVARILRGFKILFFLFAMLVSLLLFSAPLLLAVADALLPSALLSASLPPSSPLSLRTVSCHFTNYDFRYSLIDIPLVSLLRSALILCVYSFCDGPSLSRGPYLGTATVCSVCSLLFVSLKAPFVFGNSAGDVAVHEGEGGGVNRAMEMALFLCSMALAVAHVVVAYRTSCRERRKLLVYKIDIEAVSACKNGIPRYQKILQQERVK
ncbi:uncharacterized protein LOC127797515 [Diospyros lotus]|uniref:uncharacterized protein LOC127797515 n=1 Tax=Diospyros lotus TaxID=55363 RepID=UPI00225A8CBB|nr:uncharacterized protein LOC127797515 [Diospyros lotus]